jgi:tetratricopeptide (TPR) repeat protein
VIYLAALFWLFAAGDHAQPPSAPATFESVSKKATQARGENHIPEAIDLYRQALRMRSSWAEGWWFLGELLYERDKYAEARDALRKLVALDAKTGPGFALLGLCEYETKEYRRALADINEARRLGLGDDSQIRRVVLYHAVLLFTRFGMYESSLQLLERVVKLDATGEAVTEAAGLAALRKPILPEDIKPDEKDLIDRAGKVARAMAERNTEATQRYFADLLAHYPKAPNVHYFYGTYLLSTDADAGLRELQKELDLNPKHAEALIQTALEYEQRGDSGKAIAYARRAVEAAPQFFAAHAVLGRLLANAGDPEKGIQELELARQQASDSPQVHFALASAYSLAGRKKDADKERAEFLRLKKLADETSGNDAVSHP